jgi:prephenate dehydratase
MKQIRLGLSGDLGSFSEEAALLYASKEKLNPTLIHLMDMEGVLSAIEREKIELGIFPVVNLLGGLVKPAFLAMGKHAFTPIHDLWLPIQQCLLVLPGTKIHQISQIVSHAQGLAQCQKYLQNQFKDIPQAEWIDTAKAAKDLSTGNLSPSTAVIAPEGCANLYGLEVLAKNIQDSSPNLTAFIVVKK